MIESRVILTAAVLAVVCAGVLMIFSHGEHYRRRELQLLRSRVDALEKIATGDHR